MIEVVIIDDDELSRKAMKKCLERTDFMVFKEEFGSATDALKSINGLNCDLIILDVEMPKVSGIEFITQAENLKPQIVIVSSKDKYAAEAFNYDVTDYIVKPVEYDRFLKAALKVKSIKENITQNNLDQDHLFIKKNKEYSKVHFVDICYIEAYADYVNIHTKDTRYTVHSTMKAIQQRLPEQEFARVHRSFIVRLNKIKTIKENILSVDNKLIPVSRSYKSDFMKRMNLL